MLHAIKFHYVGLFFEVHLDYSKKPLPILHAFFFPTVLVMKYKFCQTHCFRGHVVKNIISAFTS